MDDKQIQYYFEMKKRGRLIHLSTEDKENTCLLTYFIGNKIDENKFVRNDMWEVLNDNPSGTICFIDQLLTNKSKNNPNLSYKTWGIFKKFIQENFRNVEIIRWNRFKNGTVKVHKEYLNASRCLQA